MKHGKDHLRCVCGRAIKGDAYLCPACAVTLGADLRRLADLIGHLELTATRQDKVSAPGDGRGTGERPLPYKDTAAELLRRARRIVADWSSAHLNLTPGAINRTGTRALCRSLADHAGQDAGRPDAPTYTTRVAELIVDVLGAIDLPQTMRYLGHCDTCGTALYAERSARLLLCPGKGCPCGYDVDARMAELIHRSRDVVASPTTIATALTSLDQPVTEERIRKWKERGKLTPRLLSGPRRQPWYRLGDVLDLLDAEAEKARLRRA